MLCVFQIILSLAALALGQNWTPVNSGRIRIRPFTRVYADYGDYYTRRYHLDKREAESEAVPEKQEHAKPAVGTEAHKRLMTEYWGQGHGPYGGYEHAHFGAYRKVPLGDGKSFICHGVNGGPCGRGGR